MTKMCEMAKINTTHTRPHHTDAFSGSYKQTWLCRTFTLSAHMHCNQMDFERFPNWRLCAHQSNISQHFRLHFSLFFNRMYTHKHRHRQSKKTPEEYTWNRKLSMTSSNERKKSQSERESEKKWKLFSFSQSVWWNCFCFISLPTSASEEILENEHPWQSMHSHSQRHIEYSERHIHTKRARDTERWKAIKWDGVGSKAATEQGMILVGAGCAENQEQLGDGRAAEM